MHWGALQTQKNQTAPQTSIDNCQGRSQVCLPANLPSAKPCASLASGMLMAVDAILFVSTVTSTPYGRRALAKGVCASVNGKSGARFGVGLGIIPCRLASKHGEMIGMYMWIHL